MPDGPRHLRPKAPRRDYYSPVVVSEPQAASAFPRPGSTPTIQDAAAALIRYHATDWAPTTCRNARLYLQLNRFPAFCEDQGLSTIDQLTTARIHDFLADISGVPSRRPSPNTASTSVPSPASALRPRATATASPTWTASRRRDLPGTSFPWRSPRSRSRRLWPERPKGGTAIVQTLLAWSARQRAVRAPGPDLNLTHRPPFLRVRGTAHDRDITKVVMTAMCHSAPSTPAYPGTCSTT